MELATRIDRLEGYLARVAAAQAELAAAQAGLAAAQMRTEGRVGELAAAQTDLAAAQTRTEGRVEELAAAQARSASELTRLTAAQTELAAAQTRTEARLEQVVGELVQLVQAQRRTEEQLGMLLNWQRDERGRREGERYERDVLRQAPALFNGGEGGTAEEGPIRRRLGALLLPLLGGDLPTESNPLLADLLWWKGEQVAVVEISRVIDGDDVDRAHGRAETVRRTGTPALPVVIGGAWDDEETREQARALRVAWKVGSDLSDGFIAFRRLPAPS